MTPQEYLFSLELHGIKLGLDNITHMLKQTGNPQHAYPTIHVAGSNGKGSVVAILDAIFRAAGYTTGRFTSPHLCRLNERFLVNRSPIDNQELDQHIDAYRRLCQNMDSPPTFFELNTAIAFRHFQRHEVDVALIEVGLGGRFDSTNVLKPSATIITNIALEHTQYLGDTLEAIAFEKAGILKPDIPLILGEEQPGPQRVILERANELKSRVYQLNKEFTFQTDGSIFDQTFTFKDDQGEIAPCTLSLPGRFQGKNAALAVATARRLRGQFHRLDDSSIQKGLASATWPCRLEQVLDTPPVIIDVAHNVAGATELAEALLGRTGPMIIAVANDKDARAMLDILAPLADPLILTTFEGSRALPLPELERAAAAHPHESAPTLKNAIQSGIEKADETHPLIIAGSLFTAGEARSILLEDYNAKAMRF